MMNRTEVSQAEVAALRASGQFDERWYAEQYPDVQILGMEPAEHYLWLGRYLGRKPSPSCATVDLPITGKLAMQLADPPNEEAETPEATPLSEDRGDQLFSRSESAGRSKLSTALRRVGSLAGSGGRTSLPGIQSFDENGYLALHPDVKAAVENNQIPSGFHHFVHDGLEEGRLASGFAPYAARQFSPQAFADKPMGFRIFGPFEASTGLGTAARSYVAAARETEFPVSLCNVDIAHYEHAGKDGYKKLYEENRALSVSPYRVTILHQNADMLGPFFRMHDRALLDDTYAIGIWAWELPNFRGEWLTSYGALDEVWAPSEFCRQAFEAFSPIPVSVIPHAVELDTSLAVHDRSYFGISESSFVFLYAFDVSSYIERKNPFALIDAFKRAFRPDQDVVLVLKYHSGRYNIDLVRRLRAAARDANIKLFPRLFDLSEMISLKNISDCFVSPHRSEGFGLNIAEAMFLGKPVIATNFSANTDYLNEDNGYPLSFKLIEVGEDTGPYMKGALWAEPDVDHLVELMQRVYRDRRESDEKGNRAAADIKERFSPQAVGGLIRTRMAELGLDRPEPSSTIRVAQSRAVAWRHPLALLSQEDIGRTNSLSATPTISVIVPVYNVPPEYLRLCIESVRRQSYPYWELCLCDDCSTDPETLDVLNNYAGVDARIRIKHLKKNLGISGASNEAVLMSSGTFIALLDNDDELHPDALMSVVEALNEDSGLDFIYTDEDKIDIDGSHSEDYHKPDWSPEHLESCMYILHMMVIRKSLFIDIGGFRVEYTGAQDYDLALRLALATQRIHHIPKILYHWRKIPGSAAATVDAKPAALGNAKKALANYAAKKYGSDVEVVSGKLEGLFRIRRGLIDNPPVTLVITTNNGVVDVPGRGLINLVDHFVRSILETTDYPDYQLLVVDNGNLSSEQARFIEMHGGRVISYDGPQKPFNFAHKANFAFSHVQTEALVLLNDDMEVINRDWLRALMDFAKSDEIGAVGAKLYYTNGSIQHAGMVAGVNEGTAHVFHGFPAEQVGYNGYTHIIRNYAALTGACLATRKTVLGEVGGFDARFATDFNDSDFVLSALSYGYRNVFTPFAELYHFESVTCRRTSQNPQEVALFKRKWGHYIENDPYYNPNLSLNHVDFRRREPLAKTSLMNAM